MSPELPCERQHPDEILPTREGYDRWAETYDDEDNPLIALEEPRVAEPPGEVGGLDVVDLGCRTGRYGARLAAARARVTAIDFSDGMLAKTRCKPGWHTVRFIEHDLNEPLPLPGAAFDRVLCCLFWSTWLRWTSCLGSRGPSIGQAGAS